jgi:hypothetical protein
MPRNLAGDRFDIGFIVWVISDSKKETVAVEATARKST